MSTNDFLIAAADARVAQYPQYAGAFVGWRAGIAAREVRTKMGLTFERGADVLVKPEIRRIHRENGKVDSFLSVFSFITNVKTSVPLASVRIDTTDFAVVELDHFGQPRG